ncbi:MAG: dipeptidase [Bacteroidia bacterium]|nr:dipeptidase [Bacteroidia bacterium]
MDPVSYLEANQERFLAELDAFLRIPSVSSDSRHAADVKRAADWLADEFRRLGADRVEIYPTPGHPVVYAEQHAGDHLPTILVYGHYDVQPPDPLDLWDSPPFEPVIKATPLHPQGAIFARGSCDDKGQVYMHVKAFEMLKQQGPLPCNVKFLVEGEEEVGSTNLEGFVKQYRDMLRAGVVLISDTSLLSIDTPSITVGLRGLAYLEVTVTGPSRDLHSGVYGGAVDNPINVLCQMIASLKDAQGRVAIPGFYDRVVNLSEAERAELARRPHDEAAYCESIGIRQTGGEAGYSTPERTSIRPTLDVNGMWGGYTGEGAKTVLPSKASAKISMRLVPDQHPDEITRLFTEHFLRLAPPTVSVTVTPHHGGNAAVVSTETPAYRAAALAMEDTFGKRPIPTREGGSIPIVALFQRELGLDPVLMGFGLDSDAIHSPNEHYGVLNYLKGIETIERFHHHFAALHGA